MAESQGPVVNSVAIIFAVISFFAIVLRIWARAFIVRSLGADDCKYNLFIHSTQSRSILTFGRFNMRGSGKESLVIRTHSALTLRQLLSWSFIACTIACK